MRYSTGKGTVARKLVLATMLAGLGGLPPSASAQDVEADASSEPNLQGPAPSSEPASEEPVLQLELDSAGVAVAPSPSRSAYGKMSLRVKRAKIGIGVSAVSLVVGGILVGVAVPNLTCEEPASGANSCPIPGWSPPVFVTGVTLAGGGVLGMIATGILLGVRKRKLRELREARYETPRRVQWDLARSRVVF